MKKLVLTITCSLLISQIVLADEKEDCAKLVRNNIDAVLMVLEKKDIDEESKKSEILEIVDPMFDFSLMAKLTLGKKYWPGLNKEEKKRFTDLFIKRLKESYSHKLLLYSNEEVIYEAPTEQQKKVQVQTYLISKDQKISILYKFFKRGNDWKIYDIEIEGVSFIQTYRSQFSEILQSGTFEDLLRKLEEPVGTVDN